MRVWRLATPLFPLLTGDGARLAGGRWNSPGVSMIYSSVHLALAVLETLVHTDPDMLPDALTAYAIEVPMASVEILDIGVLPSDWRSDIGHTRRIGDAWLRAGQTLALTVPSAVVSSDAERNVLLNPAHVAARNIKVVSREPFSFDPRLRR